MEIASEIAFIQVFLLISDLLRAFLVFSFYFSFVCVSKHFTFSDLLFPFPLFLP